jgi:MFS family permease
MPYATLMPIVAKEILGGGPQTLGFLMASSGVGAMAAALLLASRKSVRGLGKYIPRAVMLFGCGLIAVSFSTNLYLSMGCLFFGSFGALSFLASSNTILQTIVDENKRGRILSLYAMAFLGMAPFGNLLAGYVAETIGVLSTLLTGGITCIIGAFVFARHLPSIREDLRPIYIAKGIIEE